MSIQEETQQEKITRKIQALLAKTDEGANTTPEEAAAAVQKINELLTKYHLTMAQVRKEAPDAPSYEKGSVHTSLSWEVYLVGLLAEYNFVTAVQHHRDVVLVGEKLNVETVISLYQIIRPQIKHMADAAYVLSRNKANPRKWKNGFCGGAVDTLEERLKADREALDNHSKALIVNDERLRAQELRKVFPDKRIVGGNAIRIAPEGYGVGRAAGHQITYRREIKQ